MQDRVHQRTPIHFQGATNLSPRRHERRDQRQLLVLQIAGVAGRLTRPITSGGIDPAHLWFHRALHPGIVGQIVLGSEFFFEAKS